MHLLPTCSALPAATPSHPLSFGLVPPPPGGGSFGDLQLFTAQDHREAETPTQAVIGVLSYAQREPLVDGALSN